MPKAISYLSNPALPAPVVNEHGIEVDIGKEHADNATSAAPSSRADFVD